VQGISARRIFPESALTRSFRDARGSVTNVTFDVQLPEESELTFESDEPVKKINYSSHVELLGVGCCIHF